MNQLIPSGTNLGAGTCGLGPQQARLAAQQVAKEQMQSYWQRRTRTAAEWRARDSERLKQIETLHAKSSRQRLAEASAEREASIKSQMEQRRRLEAEARDSAKNAQEECNKLIVSHNERLRQQRRIAEQQRAEARQKELEQLHEQRVLLQKIEEQERIGEKSALDSHIRNVRQWQSDSREVAARKAKERLEQAQKDAQDIKKQREEREKSVESWRTDIVRAKRTFNTSFRRHLRDAVAQSVEDRQQRIAEAAVSMRTDIEARIAAREAERKKELQENAERVRKELADSRQEYMLALQRNRDVLHRDAQLQRELTRHALADERADQERDLAAYRATMQQLSVSRGTPQTSPQRSPQP